MLKPSVKRLQRSINALPPEERQVLSDGSHSFDELYYHRMILFSIICNQNKDTAWKSLLHDDGTMFDDYFIVGISTPEGDFTYHYHIDCWEYFKIDALPKAPLWDGHTSTDITRLNSLLEKEAKEILNKETIVSLLNREQIVHYSPDLQSYQVAFFDFLSEGKKRTNLEDRVYAWLLEGNLQEILALNQKRWYFSLASSKKRMPRYVFDYIDVFMGHLGYSYGGNSEDDNLLINTLVK